MRGWRGGGGGTHSCLCPIFQRPGLLWAGGEQNWPAPKGHPCPIFFLGSDLVFSFFGGNYEGMGGGTHSCL